MSFANSYLSKNNINQRLFDSRANQNLNIIVTIPCSDDIHIFKTLKSLDNAIINNYCIEVIIIINDSIIESKEIVKVNDDIYNNLVSKAISDYYNNFKLLVYRIKDIPAKLAGVGYARKLAMDEASMRFNDIENQKGIILSLDADCVVDKNYFIEVFDYFAINIKSGACVIQFQHNFSEILNDQEHLKAAKLYEMYLRYFRLCLKYSNFIYPIHTIGSCFAVTAIDYVKIGGMSTKQAGEDFYFLHKLSTMTKIDSINKILVYPSARISERVIFGTGPNIKKIINDKNYFIYNYKSFEILKQFFSNFNDYYINETPVIPRHIENFITYNKFMDIVNEAKNNSNSLLTFVKRLYTKFDALFVIKFLNYSSKNIYPDIEAMKAFAWILNLYNINLINCDIDCYYENILKIDLSTTNQ